MGVYADVVILLNFLVDLFLLLGTNRLAGFPQKPGRAALAAAVGGVYAGACLLPGMAFLGNMLWRTVSLVILCAICFGLQRSAVRRGVLFVILHMALGGVAEGLGSSFWHVIPAAVAVVALCAFGFRGRAGGVRYVPVALDTGTKRVELLALQDTGNTLTDPVTGQNVLIAAPEIAEKLLGLTREQLSDPVQTVSVGAIPGLRLVPYGTVGQENGMLLAVKIPKVQIGKHHGSSLVAFSPSGLDWEGTYQALTGGLL